MISLASAEVQGVVRTPHTPARQIPFSFRADPVALDELRLPRTARQVFVLLLDNARGRGWKSRLSNGVMGRVLSCTTMTIKRALAVLESAGLIRREMIAGGRIRLAIHVVWQGVEHCSSAAQVASGTSPFHARNCNVPPLEQPGSTNQSPSQSERSDGGPSPSNGGEAARYLRLCIEAGRRGEPMPEPPGEGGQGYIPYPIPPKGADATGSPSPKGPHQVGTLSPTPTAAPDAFLPSIGRMVASLGERLKAEDVGRRRVGPKRLAAQLAEVRRKHGRREVEMKERRPDRLSRS